MAESVDPVETATIGAVCSGSTLFASILDSSVMLGNYMTRSHARAWVVMNLAHFHTPKIIPTYTQGRSNEFES